jgi:hypothetical protein
LQVLPERHHEFILTTWLFIVKIKL